MGRKKGEQIIHQQNSSQCTSFTLTFISRDSGEIGAEEERERKEKKKREAPRYKRQGGTEKGTRADLEVCVFYCGWRAEHVLISHNATRYVISNYALCQRFTSFSLFSALPPLP